LIRDGATLVECAEHVLVELRMAPETAAAARAQRGPPDAVLDLMGFAPISMEQLAHRSGMDASHIAQRFSVLELEGRIAALNGGLFQRLEPRAS
jgi:DNA processing protein